MKTEETKPDELKLTDAAGYVAPAIEQVVKPDDMEREVHYAGAPAPSTLR